MQSTEDLSKTKQDYQEQTDQRVSPLLPKETIEPFTEKPLDQMQMRALFMQNKKNGLMKSYDFGINQSAPLPLLSQMKSASIKAPSSPLTFKTRTKDLRSNLKGSLKLGLDRTKFESSTSISSVINLEKCDIEEIEKIQESCKDQFEKQYDELEYIGEGCSAVVKKCKDRKTGEILAVKIMRNLDEERVLSAKNEFDILKGLEHPNIVNVKDFFVTPKQIYMVMEYIEGQELFDRISEIEKYDENIARKLFKQMLKAIKYLHKHNICHRDIKPSNVLVCKNENKIKLADFNISKLCTNKSMKMMTHTGTEAFAAPEMHTSEIYNEKIDLWSAGCVLYTMLAGYQPFFESNAMKLYKMIKEGDYDLKGEPWPSISSKAKDLLQKLLTVDPEKRISAVDALEHPWILNQQESTTSLQTVVKSMNHRKSIRMIDSNMALLGENHYPKIDYQQIYDNILSKGLDPIKQTRGRIQSFSEKDEMRPGKVRFQRKGSDSSSNTSEDQQQFQRQKSNPTEELGGSKNTSSLTLPQTNIQRSRKLTQESGNGVWSSPSRYQDSENNEEDELILNGSPQEKGCQSFLNARVRQAEEIKEENEDEFD